MGKKYFKIRNAFFLAFAVAGVSASLLSCGGQSSKVEAIGPDGKFVVTAMSQSIKSDVTQLSLHPSESTDVPVTIRNSMPVALPAGGAYPVRVGYILYSGPNKLPPAGPRENLSGDVAPGASAQLSVKIVAPKEPGKYRAIITMLQEGNWWFQDAGAKGLELALIVE